MTQLSIIFKENPSLIGAGAALAAAGLYNKYAINGQNSNLKFKVTNAFISLSAMLGMVATTAGSNLDGKARAIRIVGTGVATMIPTIYRTVVEFIKSK